MDNICHTLVGAALAEAGLKQRTRYGALTLMLAANLPDIDVLVFATDMPPVAFRRGWTHGLVAQAVLPIVLAALAAAAARLRRSDGERKDGAPLSVPWLLGLSYIGVCSHVGLDYLNNYGVRLLAPFDWRWFYGDAVFIIDPWLWAALGAGVWLSRRTKRLAPARGALLFAGCYIAVMLASAHAARSVVVESWRAARGTTPRALMVGPAPAVPFLYEVIIDSGDRYDTGTFSWLTGAVEIDPRSVPKQSDVPHVLRALETPDVRAFLAWSRFPYWEIQTGPTGTRATVRDMRFGGRFGMTRFVPR